MWRGALAGLLVAALGGCSLGDVWQTAYNSAKAFCEQEARPCGTQPEDVD